MREHTAELEQKMLAEVDKVRRSLRAEIVPYGAYEAEGIGPAKREPGVRIPIRRSKEADEE